MSEFISDGAASPPVALGYFEGDLRGQPGKQRKLPGWVFIACLGLFSNIIQFLIWFLAVYRPSAHSRGKTYFLTVAPTSQTVAIYFAMSGLTMVFGLAMFVYWLTWVYKTHAELRRFTGGQYPVSAGKALGFCFIPIFNLFWIVRMPWLMVRELRTHHGLRRTNPRRVLLFQVLSILPVLTPMTPMVGVWAIFTAATMVNLQNGLDDLWKRERKINSPSPSDGAAALDAMMVMDEREGDAGEFENATE